MYFFINFLIILIILQSFLVIISKNSVTSVLYLIGAYILTSFLFLILGAEFLSIILIIIYVGAVSILFIFVIMMLNVRVVEVYNTIINYIPIGLFIGCFFFSELMYMIYMDFGISSYIGSSSYTSNWIYDINLKSNLNFIGEVFYNNYYYLLWFAGLLLLLAMVGAIALTIDVDARDFYTTSQNTYLKASRANRKILFVGTDVQTKKI